MKRDAMQQLLSWKQKSSKKPLIIRGARQVGKSWLMKTFGKNEYTRTAYINLEEMKHLQSVFRQDFDIHRIVTALSVEANVKIEAENTLIILDEIQEVPEAITALKYFNENAPEFHVVCASSLLGVMLHSHTSFPVGKVEFLDLYPMSFREYLSALDEHGLLKLLNDKDWSLVKAFKEKYIQLLKQYYYLGGMPEVVYQFSKNKDFFEAREIQKRILLSYEQDFSKHAPIAVVPRIRMLWQSIPAELAKENKKFIYGAVKSGARARDYEIAINWLIDCGLVHKINRISKPALPIIANQDISAFKLYIVDVGLLAAMGNLDVKSLLEGNRIFGEFKGALTEQYVLQELKTQYDIVINYWTADASKAEVDFVVQKSNTIIPLEVKAEENLQAKSLKMYCQKFQPTLALRTSMSDFREDEWLSNIPLYSLSIFFNSLDL